MSKLKLNVNLDVLIMGCVHMMKMEKSLAPAHGNMKGKDVTHVCC